MFYPDRVRPVLCSMPSLSTHRFCRRAFSSFAYILLQSLRRIALRGTPLEKAQCGTIRLKLFKFAAQIRLSVRKVWISFSQSYPWQNLFEQVLDNLGRRPLRC